MSHKPQDVIYPKNRIKRVVRVLHDGTESGNEFSLAELELHDGTHLYGIRHDYSYWNDNNPELGSPSSFGRPTWFILPDLAILLPMLNEEVAKNVSTKK